MPMYHDFIPPMLNGVSASKVFLPQLESTPTTLCDYLVSAFPHIKAAEWQQRFQDGLIYDTAGSQLHRHSPYTPNCHIFYYRFLTHETHVPFEHYILFENEHLLVVDKPHFLTMSPTGKYVQETLLVRLKKQTNNPDLSPIHRLDRETAGIVLFSKKPFSRGLYQQLFANRLVQKTYHAIAAFKPELVFPCTVALRMEKGQPFYRMQVQDGTPNSETRIHLLQHNAQYAKYELHPKTGKQHQLRVHLSTLGIPILNDPFYPQLLHKTEDDFTKPLQLLAHHIAFTDPVLQQPLQFTSQFQLNLA